MEESTSKNDGVSYHPYQSITDKILNLMPSMTVRAEIVEALKEIDDLKTSSAEKIRLDLSQGSRVQIPLPFDELTVEKFLTDEIKKIDRYCEYIIHCNEDPQLPVGAMLSSESGQRTVLKKALETYGIDNQRLMLMEEMAELQDAICKEKRGRATSMDVITEIADVIILCKQLAIYYGVWEVEQEIIHKIGRLSDRLSKAQSNNNDSNN